MKKIALCFSLILGFPPAATYASLVASYNFDNPANPFADSSGNGNNISGTGGTAPTYGANIGFNGTGAYDFTGRLIAPVNVNPGVMPQMTWGAWVRTDSIATGLRKVMGHDDGAWDRTLGLDNRAPDGAFRYTAFTGSANNSGPVEGTPGPVNTTDWTFIAASHDQIAQTITFYIDLNAGTAGDALQSFTEFAGFGTGWPTFAIGDIRPDTTSEPWDGAIDNVFVYNEVLSAAQLTAIRNAGGVPEPSSVLLGILGAVAVLSRRKR